MLHAYLIMCNLSFMISLPDILFSSIKLNVSKDNIGGFSRFFFFSNIMVFVVTSATLLIEVFFTDLTQK